MPYRHCRADAAITVFAAFKTGEIKLFSVERIARRKTMQPALLTHNKVLCGDSVNGMRKALFLDRDGIVNEDTGYPWKPEHIKFTRGIFDFCRSAVEKGYIIVVVSNQAGVAKGLYTEEDVRSLHRWMDSVFRANGIPIARFYYCPFHVNGTIAHYARTSELRKPGPGMIVKAADDLGIDIGRSVMVGDKPSDRIALKELKSIIVRSTYSSDCYDVESLEEVTALL